LLTIKGSHSEDPGSIVEFTTEGRLFKEIDGYLLEYDESDLTGSEGVTTKILLENGSVTLSRNGEIDTQMVFSKNSVYQSNVSTPFGMVKMNILALNVSSELSDNSGNVNLEYEMSMGDVSSAGKLNLSFKSLGEWIN
jgi:uncharacterized beta-barrel protein YwiB (DUF1934 family)